jgi:hypothetical protein
MQNEGQYYDENGKRIEPVSVKDLTKQLQILEQIRRARLAVITEMSNRLKNNSNAATALPEGEAIKLDEFVRKPPKVIDVEYSSVKD